MEITGIAKCHQAGIQKSGKKSSKKDWKLSDSLREKITEYAREDAAQNVYMGNKFLALRRSEVAKVAPDRSALIGKLNQNMADMKEIREADERWLRILFGEPYEAKFQSGGTGSAVHVYDGNGRLNKEHIMKKIFCGAVIALIGVIYSIALMVLATVNDVYGNGVSGLWGLIRGYDAELPLIISLCVVMVGITVCVWGVFEKKK